MFSARSHDKPRHGVGGGRGCGKGVNERRGNRHVLQLLARYMLSAFAENGKMRKIRSLRCYLFCLLLCASDVYYTTPLRPPRRRKIRDG